MALPNIFTSQVSNTIVNRIETLTNETNSKWGKMNVAQMLAHCNVTYEMVFDHKHKAPNFFVKFLLKTLVKKNIVNEKSYKQNGQTAPQFIISEQKDFDAEKTRLVDFINKTQKLGESYFDNKESNSFGKLTTIEWNNMFYKHLDHHLNQFGA